MALTRRRALRSACLATTALGALLATAAPASAGVTSRGTETDTFSDTFAACGTTVRAAGTFTATSTLRQHSGPDATTVPYLHERIVERVTYTNLATGGSFTRVLRFTHVDVRITHVQGTVYDFTWQDAGTITAYDEDGRLVYRIAGLQRTHQRVDTLGDQDLENDVFLGPDTVERHGRFAAAERSFCQDVQELT